MQKELNKKKAKKARLCYPSDWKQRKQKQEKISILTAYDASFSRLLNASQIDALLVGDSLGMVVQGHNSTLPVCLDDMIYHCRMVRRGAKDAFIIGDMPFASYHVSAEQAISNAMRLVQEGKVDAVKFEGFSKSTSDAIKKLSESGVAVMGHLGLLPQSYINTAGYKIQGKERKQAEYIYEQALGLQNAGCFALVLELVFEVLAERITNALEIPTIGIGSGMATSGQVLVLHDLLGLNIDFSPKHAQVYSQMGKEVIAAANFFNDSIQNGKFLKQ